MPAVGAGRAPSSSRKAGRTRAWLTVPTRRTRHQGPGPEIQEIVHPPYFDSKQTLKHHCGCDLHDPPVEKASCLGLSQGYCACVSRATVLQPADTSSQTARALARKCRLPRCPAGRPGCGGHFPRLPALLLARSLHPSAQDP